MLKKFSYQLVASVALAMSFFSSAFTQVGCTTSGDAYAFESLLRNKMGTNAPLHQARTNGTLQRVGIRAVIFNETNAASPRFSTEDARLLIEHANAYFKHIRVEFYLINNQAIHVNRSDYFDFKVANESELRQQFDVTDAINLYLFHTLSDEDGVFLNGSAALPSLSRNSNRIFLSYLDRNAEDFETLKNKVFLHELGHYFGLLHTFHNSNHPEINRRELVLRDLGTGGNCDVSGDYICDTQADPFERLTAISSYGCTQTLPDNFADALGYRYQPPTDNIMSYQVRCGNVFTPQQYQRMESALGVRFSPDAAYRLITTSANTITLNSLGKNQFCTGENVVVKFSAFGGFDSSTNFVVELSDKNGGSFSPVAADFSTAGQATFTIPEGAELGAGYRLRVQSAFPQVQSSVSEGFSINGNGNLALSLENDMIRPGTVTSLRLDFDGSGPWKVKFTDGVELNAVQSRSLALYVQPLATTSYTVASVTGKCGNVNVRNGVVLTVAEPAIKIRTGFQPNVCEAAYFEVPVHELKDYGAASPYRIRLTNADTTLFIQTNVSVNSLYGLLPEFNKPPAIFRMTVEGPAVEDFSNPVELSIRPKGTAPAVVSPVGYCFNAVARPLYAFGTNLRWYQTQHGLVPSDQIVPPTNLAGTTSYFVSQLNQWGCESNRSEVKVVTKPAVSAAISGDNVIHFGDYSELQIAFTGDAPWMVELSDGQQLTSQSMIMKTTVSPKETETYTIVHASNLCGTASSVSGSAKVVVLSPLGVEEDAIDGIGLFPNPAVEEIRLKVYDPDFLNKPLGIDIFDQSGRQLIHQEDTRLNSRTPLAVDVNALQAGSYFIRLGNGSTTKTQRFLIQK